MDPQGRLCFSHYVPPVSSSVGYNTTECTICLVQWKLVETCATIFLSHVLLDTTKQKSTKTPFTACALAWF